MKNINEIYYVDLIGYCIKIQETKQILQKQPQIQTQQKIQNLIKKQVNNVQHNNKVEAQQNLIKENHIVQNTKQKEKSIEEISKIINIETKIIKLKLLKSSFFVFAPESSIKKNIKIIIKTMFSLRKLITIEISITTTFDVLKKIIFQKLGENILMFQNIRLFYPTYSLIQLAGTKTLLDQMIPDNSKLVLLSKQIFTMVTPKALGTLKFSNNNLTISKTGDNIYSTVMSNIGFQKTGRYYWQIKIENFQDEQDIFIGVADKDVDLTSCPTCAGNYWGIMPVLCKKFSCQDPNDLIDYGYSVRLGDIMGVLLEFQKELACLSFYRNGAPCGIAYKQIPGKLYPVVTLFSLAGVTQITIDPRAPCPLPERL